MTMAFSNFPDVTEHGGLPGQGGDRAELGVLAPLIAGARARGLADAFELMGTPAILLNEFGSVLHVGSSARAFLGDALCIASRHLLAAAAQSNRDLERLVAGAVNGLRDLQPIVVPRQNAPAIEIRALRVEGAANDPMQLLKAILVLREVAVSA